MKTSSVAVLSLIIVLSGACLTGCPSSGAILSVSPSVREVGASSGTTTFTISNVGTSTLEWWANVTEGGDWLSLELIDNQTLEAVFESNAGEDARVGEITISASGALGSPAIVTVVQSGAGTQGETDIVGDWGGYWWYSGTEGDLYIAWTFDSSGNWSTEIPSVGYVSGGTYAVGEPNTLDLYVSYSNTAAWVVGKTYRGYYSISGDTMYRSQMFETPLNWSPTVLNPYAATVFVADRL